ncbi:hypothetical protein, partial [Micrococcus luteus]|uniref:hypothetical protein n=1 Tax=Micrococcus luteus TaxID=1270 RepID=UPI001C5293EF
ASAWHAEGQGFESPYLHQIGCTRTPDIGRCWFGYEGGERLSESDRRPFVFADLDAVGERLIREQLVLIVRSGFERGAVDQQTEG